MRLHDLGSHLAKDKIEPITRAEHRKVQTGERFKCNIYHTVNRRKHDGFLFKFGVKKAYLWFTWLRFQKPFINVEKTNYIKL